MNLDLQSLSKADETNFEDFLFYDIEVFEYNTILVFKDINNNIVACYYNGSHELEEEGYTHVDRIYNASDEISELIKDKWLVGYNNYHYDDLVLSAIIAGKPQKRIKSINDDIIGGYKGYPFNDKIHSLDCFQQINVAKSSLKKVEANIGMDIEETSVPFDIDRELTEQELRDTIYYCSHDVKATIQIFKLRWFSYFVAKLQVTAMLPEDMQQKALRWNTTTITANLLTGGKSVNKWLSPYLGSRIKLTEKELAETKNKMFDLVPPEVAENWESNKIKKLSVSDLGCKIEFGQGGLHGVPENSVLRYSNVKLLDVTSLYPNIILHIDALGEYTPTYKNIVDERVKVKHTDTILSNALKLVINATYGLMKNKYSKLLNEKAALAVCIYGQIILYDLCKELKESGYKLININTDGVAFIEDLSFIDEHGCILKNYMDVKKDWEETYGFELELSEFDTWIQKDVNNYVAQKDGYIKVKGGMVNHYHDPLNYEELSLGSYAGVNWSGTNSLGIIHKVLVDVLIQDEDEEINIQKRVLHYIYDDPQPILFQYILQAGNTYLGVFDKEGNEYQKVNRVFATKNKGVTLLKHKEMTNSDGEKVISKQNFPNAPENMYVFNGDLKDFKDFQEVIDVKYYVDLIKEKLKLWH